MSSDIEPDGPDPELAGRLADSRPFPAPDFRGSLRRALVAADPGYGPRPARLRARVVIFLALGALLLVIGFLQSIGAL
jgi:hypothetical protein